MVISGRRCRAHLIEIESIARNSGPWSDIHTHGKGDYSMAVEMRAFCQIFGILFLDCRNTQK